MRTPHVNKECMENSASYAFRVTTVSCHKDLERAMRQLIVLHARGLTKMQPKQQQLESPQELLADLHK